MELIIGSIVSLLVQFLKSKFGGGMQTMMLLIVLSLASAGLYVILVNAGLWESATKIIVTAGAFYAFILQRFETNTQTPA